jgi:hypothetical protein
MQLRALVLAAVTVGLAVPARATVVVVPPLEEMAVASDIIAEVVVGDARVMKEGGRVVTYTALEVKDGWKGVKTGDQVELFQLGGDLDGRSSWIVGAQRFKKGERFVFFGMRSKTRAAVIPFGIGFGVFKIDEQLTGEKVIEVVGDVVTLDKSAAPGAGAVASNAPATRRYDTLPAFKALVEKALAGEELPQMNLNKTKILPKQKVR